ncbi:hypothetical protein GMORB2_5246 [Geosmithia morbida]|uniref:Uncharacterized protein n=1 Tax=Geosmithia morbida TaxID=1094350 RepID=A0A9P5D6B2_9HYPO|nr:uncharacterized protein GMORB2_5246 [Geosmithia morbida]KAF4124580.1 hypothetical protein GMORB2_5246 [Geosmithia morbida]
MAISVRLNTASSSGHHRFSSSTTTLSPEALSGSNSSYLHPSRGDPLSFDLSYQGGEEGDIGIRYPDGVDDDDDGLTDLIDFLRNHVPPPGNYMSMPENAQDERRRWLLNWATRMAKRHAPHGSSSGSGFGSGFGFGFGPRRRPPRILLPDTAVSGTTIGGHRHIAITIPSEAFPLRDDRPRSQYPVYRGETDSGDTPLVSSPVRTVVNDKGVVTVLKTVDEVNEPLGYPSDLVPRRSHSQSMSLPPSRAGHSSVNGFVPSPSSVRAGASPRPGGDDAAAGNGSGPSRMPSRSSQTPAHHHQQHQQHQQHSSIDGVLSHQQPQNGNGKARQTPSPGPKSDWSLDEREWFAKVQTVAAAAAAKPREDGGGDKDKDVISSESGATVMRENPLGPRDPEGAALSRNDSVQSRRARVRDRKRRDIEAARADGKQKQPGDAASTVAATAAPATAASASAASAATTQPALSPIRTVMDIRPSPTPSEPTLTDTPSTDRGAFADEDGGAGPKGHRQRSSVADRSSLQHRRERDAASSRRDQDQHQQPQQRKSTTTTTTAPSARQSAVDSKGGDNTTDSRRHQQNLDREILRLYEAYREHRFRDMERRVRRLERNGDVWLRALVPVLENLNRVGRPGTSTTSAAIAAAASAGKDSDYYESPLQRQRAQQRYDLGTGRAPPVRRPTTCSGRIPGFGARPDGIISSNNGGDDDDDDDEEGDGVDDDHDASFRWRDSTGSSSNNEMSGLDTIEPLMRELAGAAKLRQMKTGRSGLLSAF